jgi:lipopolysaccharide export LptBFGC system permease protein LptF
VGSSPNPLGGANLPRVIAAGAALAGLGIALFVGLWELLGQAGVDQAPRLFAALCAPPGVIALILGIYTLLRRPS